MKTKMDSYLDFFDTQEKAIDYALWLNFKYRIASIKFGIIHGPDDNWAVLEKATSKEIEMPFLDILPKEYSKLSYQQIQKIAEDKIPHTHWEMIRGMFTSMDGEILRFILHYEVPMKRFIRWELASRGHDKHHRWCGFKKASIIWLENK